MTQLAIETSGLTKRFLTTKGWRDLLTPTRLGPPVVDRVDLAIPEGELFGLVGPNGAGKTTLIKLLCTLIIPTTGTARVNGHDLRDDRAIKASIGLVTSDERSFYWRLTGRQNLQFFATLHNIPSDQLPDRIHQALDQAGLRDEADKPFQIYSTGMRQRLAIARALLSQPRILFMDEPTKSLDPTATQQLHRLIREQLVGEQGLTIFMTTHRLSEAEKLCDRVAIIHQGRIRACGAVPDLRDELGLTDAYRIRVQGLDPAAQTQQVDWIVRTSSNPVDQDPLLEVEIPDEGTGLDEAIDGLRRRGGRIQEIARVSASLDTIFAQVTERTESSAPSSSPSPPPQPPQEPGKGGARSALRIEIKDGLRIAAAFLQREIRSEMSYKLSFILRFWSIFFSVGLFYFIARLLGEAALPLLATYGGDYFSFVIIGIAFSGYFGVGLSSFAGKLRSAQTTGTLEAMLTTPTRISTIVLCSSLWSYLMTTLNVLVYLAMGGLFLGMRLGQGNYPAALLILILSVISFSSFGILAASFIMVLKRGDPVTWLLHSLSNLLSGVYYPIDILPGWLRLLSYLLPMTYSLRAMRLALLQGASFATLAPDMIALALFSLIFFPLSLAAFRYAVRRARIDGSLTHY